MMLPSPRLLRRLRQRRRPLLVLLLLLFLLDAVLLLRARPRTKRVSLEDEARLLHQRGAGGGRAAAAAAAAGATNTSVFIASVHRNTGPILPAWGAAVLGLVDHLGRDRVHFSALESGSQDDTKARLADLAAALDARGVASTVRPGLTVWEQLDEQWARPDPAGPRPADGAWIWNPEDRVYDLRRIPYLARERNRALEPLWELARRGVRFDKVLWINDVVFDTEDFVTLLHTNDGNYAAACSMDFKYASQYYDTFALRDDEGRKTASTFWPWFLSPAARAAAARLDPIRVEACWNGMVLFDAAPFYGDLKKSQDEDGHDGAHPEAPTPIPLRFRGIPDSLADLHLEASECCLIHADNPLSRLGGGGGGGGVWLNPNVRVAYSARAYDAVRGRHGAPFPAGVWATVAGAWANRWLGWRAPLQQRLEAGTVLRRVRRWMEEGGKEAASDGSGSGKGQGEEKRKMKRSEPGVSCLVNEKQIMWMNGWKHL